MSKVTKVVKYSAENGYLRDSKLEAEVEQEKIELIRAWDDVPDTKGYVEEHEDLEDDFNSIEELEYFVRLGKQAEKLIEKIKELENSKITE